MVSFQKNIKKYQRVLGYMFLVIMVLITHLKNTPCDPLTCFCACRNGVLDVAFTNKRKAFMGV
jgi:hypothetical protein